MRERPKVLRLIDAMSAWAAAGPHGCRASGGKGGFSSIQFHSRPDPRAPEVQLTLRPTIVDGEAVIQIPELETDDETRRNDAAPSTNTRGAQIVQPLESPATSREADAVCEGCGRTGTIGRAVRTASTGEPIELHRFCAACWPEQSARYRARWREEDRLRSDQFFRRQIPAEGAGRGMHFVAPTWHATLEMIEQIERSMRPQVPPSPEDLARLAADIERRAPELEGEMPFMVEAFIHQYGSKP